MNIPKGFLFSGIHSGIKNKGRDLGLVYSCFRCRSAILGTKNDIKSYSLEKTLENNRSSSLRAVLVNSGNANCCSGLPSQKRTEGIFKEISWRLSLFPQEVAFLSTGIIGVPLDFGKIRRSFPRLIRKLSPRAWKDFSSSILTTDTFPKVRSASLRLRDKTINILGIAKGAGMIYPQMATMLGFVFTDASIKEVSLRRLLREAFNYSFLRINIDSSMSTNDCFLCLSNSASDIDIESDKKFFNDFKAAFLEISRNLAQMIVKDAEGSTKFITIRIKGLDFLKAKKVADILCGSFLFKSSIYGGSCNWGRVIQAAGQANLGLKEKDLSISYFSRSKILPIFKRGKVYLKNRGLIERQIISRKEVGVFLEIKGVNSSKVFEFYTSDLSPQYIRINR